MKAAGEELSSEIANLANEFAEGLVGYAGTDGNIREAVAKSGLRDVVWAVLERFPMEQGGICETLEIVADLVRNGDIRGPNS
jgi:hypothetical protein